MLNDQQTPSSMITSSFIQTNVPLNDKNWFRTGGNARYFATPRNEQEFTQALAYARTHNLDLFVLGSGANVLVSDDGFDGLVIHPHLQTITVQPTAGSTVHVTVGAGVTMHDLINYCLDNNIIGLEEFSGIPGTIGGSVYINLHYFEFLLEQFLVECQVINRATGIVSTVDRAWCNFGYNQSTLQQHDYYVVSATFVLKRCSPLETAYARGRSAEITRHRFKRYPHSHTCGSFFRNFYDHEVMLATSQGKKLIFVAYYLDKIGVKGTLCQGEATVSHQHANMLINKGNATSTDIITLARTMQQLVEQQFGIIPQPECLLVGFTYYPLLK